MKLTSLRSHIAEWCTRRASFLRFSPRDTCCESTPCMWWGTTDGCALHQHVAELTARSKGARLFLRCRNPFETKMFRSAPQNIRCSRRLYYSSSGACVGAPRWCEASRGGLGRPFQVHKSKTLAVHLTLLSDMTLTREPC